MIFVFGSNLRGIHGAGAALFALQQRGAVMGKGQGLWGQSWALPTCDVPGSPLNLSQIKEHVEFFLEFARKHSELQFQVTRVGCGFAGYKDFEIGPLFQAAPDNVWLPSAFARAIGEYMASEVDCDDQVRDHEERE